MSSNDAAFGPGMVVKLRSGGPRMTVRECVGANVICEWFDGSKERKHSFLAAQLEKSIDEEELRKKIMAKLSRIAQRQKEHG